MRRPQRQALLLLLLLLLGAASLTEARQLVSNGIANAAAATSDNCYLSLKQPRGKDATPEAHQAPLHGGVGPAVGAVVRDDAGVAAKQQMSLAYHRRRLVGEFLRPVP